MSKSKKKNEGEEILKEVVKFVTSYSERKEKKKGSYRVGMNEYHRNYRKNNPLVNGLNCLNYKRRQKGLPPLTIEEYAEIKKDYNNLTVDGRLKAYITDKL